MYTDLKMHAGPQAKIPDVLRAVRSKIAIHVANTKHQSLQEVYASVYKDDSLVNAIKQQSGRQHKEEFFQGLVNSFLLTKHSVGQLLLEHADYYKDITGQPANTPREAVVNSIKNFNPRDADLIDQIPSLKNLLVKQRDTAIEKKADKLRYPALPKLKETVYQDKLRKAYIEFHLALPRKRNTPEYPLRLGEYYFNVINITEEPQTAFAFIRDNFNLLIQPPPSEHSEIQIYTKPKSPSAVAETIRALSLAKNTYQKDLLELRASLFEVPQPKVKKSKPIDIETRDLLVTPKVIKLKPQIEHPKSDALMQKFNLNTNLYKDILDLSQSVGGLEVLALLAQTMAEEGLTQQALPDKKEKKSPLNQKPGA